MKETLFQPRLIAVATLIGLLLLGALSYMGFRLVNSLVHDVRSTGEVVIRGLSEGTQQQVAEISEGLRASVDYIKAVEIRRDELEGFEPPIPPGRDLLPPGPIGGLEVPVLYLALGDSLADAAGVQYPQQGYVSRFHGYLQRESGYPIGLLNLGKWAANTQTILDKQLPVALEEIRRRRVDGDPSTRVHVITVNLGANNVLRELASNDCLSHSTLNRCRSRVDNAISDFPAALEAILASLVSEMENGTECYVMNIYNPFDLGEGTELAAYSDRIVQALNFSLHQETSKTSCFIADAYTVMRRRTLQWTNLLSGDFHPNAQGYQALAFSLVQAREDYLNATGQQ